MHMCLSINCIDFFKISENFYPHTFVEECKYVVKHAIFLSGFIKLAGVTQHSQLNNQEIYFVRSISLLKFWFL